jgi:hypothetical protein
MKDYFTNVLIAESLEYATFFYIFCNQIGI